MEQFVYKDKKKLRCGYTTGSCATAAAKAAALTLLLKDKTDSINIETPKGISLTIEIIETVIKEDLVTCCVVKDAGDDADVTDRIKVYATVRKIPKGFVIDGGAGVGRITRPGLNQGIGEAAINRVPREMIQREVNKVLDEAEYLGGIEVIISIPEGVEIAKKTFNPKLGIVGGISVLGTSGIVEPMSEAALIDTIKTEISVLRAEGKEYLAAVPGNYGEVFAKGSLKLMDENMIKCSNFIGETIDLAGEYRLKGLLLAGHIGKFVKLGGGIMNTHSKFADCRQEILASCTVLAGGDTQLAKIILNCITTEEALDYLKESNLMAKTMDILMEKIDFYLHNRASEGLTIGAVMFSNKYGLLGHTRHAKELIDAIRLEGE